MEDPKNEVLDAYCRIFSKVEEWDVGEQLIVEGVGKTSFKIFSKALKTVTSVDRLHELKRDYERRNLSFYEKVQA